MIKKLTPHFLPISLLVLITVVVHHVWFFNLSPITYGDWTIDHLEKVKELLSLPTIWKGENNLGGVDLGIFFWPLQLLIGILENFKVGPALLERIFTLWPVALMTPLSMYFFSYYILRSRIASLLGSIVFTFNTFLIISRSGPVLLNLALSFAPFLFLFFMKTLEDKKLSYSLVAALLAFIISFFEIRFFYLIGWVLFFYFIYHLFILDPKAKTNIKVYFLAGLVISLPLLMNLYAVLGLQNLQSLTSNEIFNRTLFGSSYLKLAKIMSLFHFGWTGGRADWIIQTEPLRFFLIPALALLGLALTNNKKVAFFGLLALIGIFLTKMNLPPFPDVYQWLFDNLPGFNAFRESGKFSYFIVLSFAVLIASFIKVALDWGKEKKYKLLSYAATAAIAFLFLWNAKPIITGELGSLYVQRQIPKEYFQVKDFILGQRDYFRTLWIPLASQWGIRSNDHPMMSNYYLNLGIWNKFVKENNGNIFGANFSDQLLDLSSIKYVVVPLEDKANDDNFFRFAGKRQDFIDGLNNLKYLNKISTRAEKVSVYENYDYRPHIYITNEKESIDRSIPYTPVDFSLKTPTEYKIALKSVSSTFYLNFSENYHPSWKLRIGEFNWLKAISAKNYFLPDKYHFENEAKLNSFLIDPQSLCHLKKCDKDFYGNYNLEFTLFFQPQSYVYLGLIISSIFFASVVLTLVYLLLKRK